MFDAVFLHSAAAWNASGLYRFYLHLIADFSGRLLVKPMRVLFMLLTFVISSAAAEAFLCVLLDTKDANGNHVQFRYDANALWTKPMWAPGGEGPQLSLEAATKIAYDAALRQSPKASGVSFGDIKLLHNDCYYGGGKVVTWFWDFSVRPVIDQDGNPSIFEAARDIVILFDGEVVQPTPVE